MKVLLPGVNWGCVWSWINKCIETKQMKEKYLKENKVLSEHYITKIYRIAKLGR